LRESIGAAARSLDAVRLAALFAALLVAAVVGTGVSVLDVMPPGLFVMFVVGITGLAFLLLEPVMRRARRTEPKAPLPTASPAPVAAAPPQPVEPAEELEPQRYSRQVRRGIQRVLEELESNRSLIEETLERLSWWDPRRRSLLVDEWVKNRDLLAEESGLQDAHKAARRAYHAFNRINYDATERFGGSAPTVSMNGRTLLESAQANAGAAEEELHKALEAGSEE
jgi:hypothetical protein